MEIPKQSIYLDDSKWKIYKTFNNESEKNKNSINDIDKINILEDDNNIENIKSSIYSKLDNNSSKFKMLLEKYNYLKKENIHLKQVIKNKDKIISEFGILFQRFKEKFIKLEEINQLLKNKLNNNKISNTNKIEKDYNIKLKEKDKMLEKMNEELLYMHNEYKNLTNNLEKISTIVNNNKYIELKNKIIDLSKEKNDLIKQNEIREKKILDLIIKNEDEIYNNNIGNDNDNLLVTFKNQENEYIKTINMLQNRIVDKDKEIQMIKDEFKKILSD